ncbi:unnamed protein product [Spirodela intermedia]|nr:unnamed protein product [Spirodela intermedia]CAA6661645.1 unnamed protein product [Spirodela intermedia]
MGRRKEVAELGSCRHAFHRRCIDGWADEGWRTCPLCRSRMPLVGEVSVFSATSDQEPPPGDRR